MNDERPIIVTGTHRSGSTWVGKMLSASPEVAYIHEPFNPIFPDCGCGACFDKWFLYVSKNNSDIYKKHFQHILNLKYPASTLTNLQSLYHLKIFLKRKFQFFKYKNQRPLIKDPIALFSVEWLAKTFDMDVVVLIRHPAAFVSSIMRKDWTFPFEDLLAQEELMETLLRDYRTQIEEYSKTEKDIVEQAALLWTMFHDVILQYRERHPNWKFVRHKDLSENPITEYRKLYNFLDIPFNGDVKEIIKEASAAENPAGPQGSEELLKRDSKANIDSWKTRLDDKDIYKIKNQVEEISSRFYSESEW
ncbi:MAG: sulfotransferase [Bacteroidia bacterium]